MRAERIHRDVASAATLYGAVLVADVRDDGGRIVLGRGTRVDADDAAVLMSTPWTVLTIVRPSGNDVLEAGAGTQLAGAAAGDHVRAGPASGGHWPLTATARGILEIRHEALRFVNRQGDLAVYTLPDGQVVDAGEVVARVKIIPFVVDGSVLQRAVAESESAAGLVTVRTFAPRRIGVVVQESLGSSALERFQRALDEKAAWFGSTLLDPCVVARHADSIAASIQNAVDQQALLVVVAGTMAMDPLDPAFEAVRLMGGMLERVGVPAHPGSLLWLARIGAVRVVGMPSCGLFSRATVFDLVLPRLLAGLPVDTDWLGSLGHGGLLTRDVAARFPPYRARQERGAVD